MHTCVFQIIMGHLDFAMYLAHVFVSCVSGRRPVPNEISLFNTGAIATLASGIEFNFSKFILHELILNIEANKRDSDQSGSESVSKPTVTEDVVILVSEPGNEQGDEDLNEDDDFLKDLDFTGINNDDIPSNFDLDLDDDEFGPLPGFDDRHFRKVNEVAQPATKTGDDVNALKILFSSSKPMEYSSRLRDVVSGIPPLDTNVSTSIPSLSEPT
ncbi:unnamed protein product [Lactuca saligna]|uniref:Uncharacterized protein n=1 Tax=Lactuca saligna TaxID=75948 RepID=A0AA35YYE1_LACSI|nr:unnamed protein product [Lactuca saligna]